MITDLKFNAMPQEKKVRNLRIVTSGPPTLLLVICVLGIFCLLPLESFSQYYPAPPILSSRQIPKLLKQERSFSSGYKHIEALNLLSNVYFNLPQKKPSDLILSHQYAQKALDESGRINDAWGRSYALLMLGQLYCFNNEPASAERLLTLAKDTTKVKLLLQISFYYWGREGDDYIHDSEHCISNAQLAASLSQKLGLSDLILMCRRNIAMAHSSLKTKNAEAELLLILADYHKAGYKNLHYIYIPLTLYYLNTNRPDKAYYYTQAAVNSVEATKDSVAAGDAFLEKAGVEMNRGSYSDAMRSVGAAVKYYNYYSGWYNISSPYIYNLGSAIYDQMGKKKEAINYVTEMMNKYPARNATDSIMYLKRIGYDCKELKRFREAEYYFNQIYAISQRDHIAELPANFNLGQLYLDSRQYKKARPYLYKALSCPEFAFIRVSEQRQLHYMLFLADSATHHYLDAIKHQNFLNSQSEVNARLERDKIVKKMEVAYKTLEKEQEIKLKNQDIVRLTQQAIAQQEKLQQSRQIGLLSAGGLVLTLIILILVYFLYRQKQRSNQKMAGKNDLLQRLLSEKEWLLKEVHHRVKNNLHTIFCLLESQARTARPQVRNALEKSQLRVYAMSLFHQKIYQSEDMNRVNFAFYLRDFLVFLESSFDLEAMNIRITHDLEAALLPIELAMPLALVVNEALTNAVKYAFVGRSHGEIGVKLKSHEQSYLLTITDNGIGMPDSSFSTNGSLGLELMHGLCADIGAQIHFQVHNGTRIKISFIAEEVVEL